MAGFGILFGGREYVEYKIGVFPASPGAREAVSLEIPEGLRTTRFLQFVGFASREEAMAKLRHHKIDFVIQAGPPPHHYWISYSSHKGYLVEKIFQAGLMPPGMAHASRKGRVESAPIRYIDWLFPGILAMNMMFLSEVWFSLEGAPQWARQLSQIFPLTQLLQGIRKITNDGATLAGVLPEVGMLLGMTIQFLAAGAYRFSWDR